MIIKEKRNDRVYLRVVDDKGVLHASGSGPTLAVAQDELRYHLEQEGMQIILEYEAGAKALREAMHALEIGMLEVTP